MSPFVLFDAASGAVQAPKEEFPGRLYTWAHKNGM
jgi:hypothetical protein